MVQRRSHTLRNLRNLVLGASAAAGVVTVAAGTPVLAFLASVNSLGDSGIDALRLRNAPYQLTGSKIAIGQVEIGRPALFGIDKAARNNFVVRVTNLFFRDGLARPNQFVDEHASNVASVMVSRAKEAGGVAPNARLFSAAAGAERRGGQAVECLAAQTVALQNSTDVRAINFSFGESLQRDARSNARLDGNALLTQCIDWSANQHKVLYVIAGNQGQGGIPIPTDNFNGMTITNSNVYQGVYRKVDFSSLGSEPTSIVGRAPELESNVGPRRSVSLVAPGTNIQMINPDGSPGRSTGTSFSAPHVTGTVALIQEYGDRQLRNRKPNWTVNARRPEVTKAILMNSADKVQDQGNGLLLGMSRTAVSQNLRTWLQSDAFRDEKLPLDADLGTGHLNAYRAIQQFSPGQHGPGKPVPAIGWDYNTVGTSGTPRFRDYVIDRPLQAGSYVSATLTWNRKVDLNDTNKNGRYDVGETFSDRGLNNLDIYLMRAEDNDTSKRIWSSVSPVDSVEHIFHPVRQAGRYKIRVVYRDRVNTPTQSYSLAWWTTPTR